MSEISDEIVLPSENATVMVSTSTASAPTTDKAMIAPVCLRFFGGCGGVTKLPV